jgi:hypothetical protein
VAQLLARDTIHFDIFLIISELKLMKGLFGGVEVGVSDRGLEMRSIMDR